MRYLPSVVMIAVFLVVWVCAASAAEADNVGETSENKQMMEALKTAAANTSAMSTEESTITLPAAGGLSGVSSSAPGVPLPNQPNEVNTESVPSASDHSSEHKSSGDGLQLSQEATEIPKAKPQNPGGEGEALAPVAQTSSPEQRDSHNERDIGAAGEASQSQQNQSQMQKHTEKEEEENNKRKEANSTGPIERSVSELENVPSGATPSGKLETVNTESSPTRTKPLLETQELIPSKVKTKPPRAQGASATTPISPTGTISRNGSPRNHRIDNKKNEKEELQNTDSVTRPKLSTDVPHPTTTEADVTIMQDISETTANTADASTTINSSIGTVRKDYTIPPLSTVSNALPLLNSVGNTDSSLVSSSLFALAALATLAVAAAAPAH